MVVFILERVPATVRGEMSRWMIEPRHGVFIGTVSAMVRERLWEMVGEKLKGGGALLLYSSPTEQGFKALSVGDTSRSLRECEGLQMVHIPTEQAKKKDTFTTRVARSRARVRFSPDDAEESPPASDVSPCTATGRTSLPAKSPAVRSARLRERPLGKTHPLYGPQGPADASEIAMYCHDPGYGIENDADTVLSSHDPALAPVRVRWRPVAPRDIFAD